jgi:hypothetical protein
MHTQSSRLPEQTNLTKIQYSQALIVLQSIRELLQLFSLEVGSVKTQLAHGHIVVTKTNDRKFEPFLKENRILKTTAAGAAAAPPPPPPTRRSNM